MWRAWLMRVWWGYVAVVLMAGAGGVHADTLAIPAAYSSNCASCHSPKQTEPPMLPSDSSRYGKILSTADYLASESNLRDAILNNANMTFRDAHGAVTFSPVKDMSVTDLESIRQYLISYRDGSVTASVTAFPPTGVGAQSSETRTVTLSNFRTKAVSYALALQGDNPGDFSATADASSSPCAGQSVPAFGSCTVTVSFKPTAKDTRKATLHVSFPVASPDPSPISRDIDLRGSGQVLAPVVSFPASLPFSAVVGSTSDAGTFRLTNNGNAPFKLTQLSFTGPQASEFSLDGSSTCMLDTSAAPKSYGSGEYCDLTLRYTPVAKGASLAYLVVTYNASGSPTSIALNGTATEPLKPALSLSVSAMSFADQVVLTNSPSQTLTITNKNGQAPLILSNYAMSGDGSLDYSLSTSSCYVGTSIAIDGSCTISVTFSPRSTGLSKATITITSNAPTASVSLQGSGKPKPAPVATWSSLTLPFGAQTVGGIYPTRKLTLTNTGTADLLISSVSVSGAGFSLDSQNCPATLTQTASCTASVRFDPTTAGASYSGNLTVSSTAAAISQSAALTGQGVAYTVPVLSWNSDAPIIFMGIPVGTVSLETKSLTLTNHGPGGAKLTLLNVIGPNGADFSAAGACVADLQMLEGDTCQVTLTFVPSGAGVRQGSLQLVAAGSTPSLLSISGVGVGSAGSGGSGAGSSSSTPGLTLSASALTFGGTQNGTPSSPQQLTLSNTGAVVMQITSVTSDTGAFRVGQGTCPSTPFSLSPGGACQVNVVFAPASAGTSAGTLSIATDQAAQPSTVPLSGTGTDAPKSSGGGCTMTTGRADWDPTLWLLAAGAALLLGRRALRCQAGRAGDFL